ncbi:MAG: PASTA domain-containing protein, partial [Eubacteriales bacterium]
HYLSPEQAKGAAQITEQSDIYSLGIIFYELITGKVPYDGDTPITIALKHIQEQPEFPDKVVKGVSEELNAVILKTIAKSLDDRYKNAAELLLDLQKLESGETIVGKEKYKQSNGLKGDETLVHKGLREKILEKNTNDPIKSNKKRLTTPVLIILIIGLILGIAGGAYAVNSYFYAANVEVPDLSGLTIEQAKLKLEQKELVLGSDSKYVYDDEVELNNIISQSIKSGSMVKTGRTIDVTVSRGVEMVKFPDVTSMSPTQENAVNMIREAGFDVDKIQYVPKLSSVVEEGKVVGQSPAAYATWPTNGKITLSISGGEKLTTETMPDVIGMSSSEATNILNEYKLNVVVERQGSDLFPIDAVMVTSPSQGKPVKQGTEVKMIVSVGPGPLP